MQIVLSKMKGLLVILLAFSLSCGVTSGKDVCTQVTTDSASAKMVQAQILPNAFIVDIEVVKDEESVVQHMTMYYNKGKNMIRLDVIENQVTTSMYFYFKDNEILKFDFKKNMGRGTCTTIQDLSNSVDSFLFGGTQTGTSSPSVPAPLAAIHFMGMSGFGNDKIQEKYIGKATVRAKEANKYTSCQRWNTLNNDIVLNVTHYFADESYQFPFTNKKWSTLLSMEVSGTGKVAGVNKKIDHIYNYFNFRSFESGDTSLETPEGIVCKGRKQDKPFPKLPNMIRYTGEVVDMLQLHFQTKEVLYDYDKRLGVMKSVDKLNSKADMNTKTMFFDFNSDVLMIVDEVQISCQATTLSSYPLHYDMYTVVRNKARMYTPQQFFMADPKDFTFLGQKQIRGMMTDVWVAPTSLIPNTTNAVVQFHFAPPVRSWNDKNANYKKEQWPIPLKSKIWLSDKQTQAITENIFHVDYNPVQADYVDLTPCYKYHFQMQIVVKGHKQDVVNSYQDSFIAKIKSNLGQSGSLSVFQITQMKLFYNKEDMFIEFMVGGQDKNALKNAVTTMTNDLKSKKVVINAKPPNSEKWTTVLPLVSVSSVDVYAANHARRAKAMGTTGKDSGYSAGSMAGLGIGMVIIGLAGGAGAGYAHGKYFG